MKILKYGVLILSIIISAGIFAVFLILNQLEIMFKNPSYTNKSVTPAPTLHLTGKVISFSGVSYGYEFIKAKDDSKIELVPNFSDRKTSMDLKDEFNCQAVVNGGFYDQNNRPLGLFIAEGKTYRSIQKNRLIDGFIWSSTDNDFGIDFNYLPETPQWALQNGPMLLYQSQDFKLDIRDDKPARRIVAAINKNGNLIFLVIFNPEQVYEGPNLEDLPEVIELINKQENLEIFTAINLDGGSASVFIKNKISLTELTTVGSVFCIK